MIWRWKIRLDEMAAGVEKVDLLAGQGSGKNFEQIPLQSGYRRDKKKNDVKKNKRDNDRGCYVMKWCLRN